MLFVKCKSRGEQLGVVIGMLILVAACYGVGKFFLGMGEASMESAGELSSTSDLQADTMRLSLTSYATVAICAGLGLIFLLMAIINLVRFLTGTGLADPSDGWS